MYPPPRSEVFKEENMYQIIKRDGKIVEFDINKIANAIKKVFEATETEYT